MITGHNPDILSCLANLSSDEVFTPPRVAGDMLDLLPATIWSDPNATFLDPVCKTGVFLREIARRLDAGLESQIPDLQERINHIFRNQVFGIGITELTALTSRRSVYCSKHANGKYSVSDAFDDEQGNIRFKRIKHSWKRGRCVLCGASKSASKGAYNRGEDMETHAYEFIHTAKNKKVFDMEFDVIIGNPPYHLDDGGFGRSATPIYQTFVEKAKELQPRYLTMIIPARWFAGGKGLSDFRNEMLNDSRIRKIVDYENAGECFPGVDIAGGVCYFLWDRENPGLCEVVSVLNGNPIGSTRSLNEFPTFIRHSQAVPIIRKVMAMGYDNMSNQVSSRKPFGLPTNARPLPKGDIKLRWNNGEGPYKRSDISVGVDLIDKYKVITSYVGYDHAGNPGPDGRRRVLSKIDILPPGTICTETYLVIGYFESEAEAKNLVSYMKTKMFRFLLSQFMYSHHITKDAYRFVPVMDSGTLWTDETLYQHFGLTTDEIAFIESKIRPMESVDE